MHKQKPNSIRGKIWAHDKKTPSDFFTPHSKLQSVPGVHCAKRRINIEKARVLMSGGRLRGAQKMRQYGGYDYCAFCGSRHFHDGSTEEAQKFYALMNTVDETPRGKAIMHKLFYANEWYDVIQHICPVCLRKELKRLHIDLSSYQQELDRIQNYAKEHSRDN